MVNPLPRTSLPSLPLSAMYDAELLRMSGRFGDQPRLMLMHSARTCGAGLGLVPVLQGNGVNRTWLAAVVEESALRQGRSQGEEETITIPHVHVRASMVNEEAAVPDFPPVTHVAVTVTDLERSTRWYSELFAATPVLDEDEPTGFHHTVFALDGGQLFGLHTHPQTTTERFDEHRTGLDHVAFACRDRAELQKQAARLDELGIAHGGVKDAHYGSGVSFRDPDGIALEFFAPPA